MNTVSLISGPIPVMVLVGGALGILWLLIGGRRYLLRTVPLAAVVATALTLLLGFLAETVFQWWDSGLPRILYLPAALTLLALVLGLPRLRALMSHRMAPTGPTPEGVGARRRARPRTCVLATMSVIGSVVLVALAAGAIVNIHFGQFPTLASALGENGVSGQDIAVVAAGPGQPATAPVTESTWTAPPGMPAQGTVYSVTIPGLVSGYQSAPALVYVPPAYLGSPKAVNLPVLVLLHGQPGAPVDWLNGGQLAQMMDAYAAAHQGLTPIVVLPDLTNNGASNPPLCMDTTVSRSATYLAVDVPAWVKQTLGAGTSSNRQWAIAGFSYGGTCTMQLATNHPDVYPTFIDISGENEPTVPGGRSALITTYFSGDAAAFSAQNALDRLATGSFNSSTGVVVTGAQDTTYGPQGQQVYDAAKAAGMSVTLQVLPGGHSWQVWKPGLQNNLGWLTGQLGLTSP